MGPSIDALAAEAAVHWHGTPVRLISNRENSVFEMVVPGGRAALRLHRQGYQGGAAIQSELWWCASLARSGVAVPAALPSRDGSLLVELSSGRNASVIDWVDGDALGEAGVPFAQPLPLLLDQHRALGQLVAALHDATDKLTLPDGFTRPFWDIDGLVGNAPFWGRFWEHPAASPAQAQVLVRARDYLRLHLTDLAANGADFGPIHADLLRENILVNGTKLSLIDFDDSGIGFRLYDLGTVMSQNLYEPAYAQIMAALIEGYNATRAASVEVVELFALARTCASVGWTMPRLAPDNPIHHSHIARAVMLATRLMD